MHVGIGIHPVSVESRSHLRSIGDRQRRRYHVPYGLELAASEIEHAIKPGAEGCTGREVLSNTEILEKSGSFCLKLVRLGIVILVLGTEEPVHAVRHGGSQGEVLEYGECRKSYGEIVRHTRLHLVPEIRVAHLAGLEIDLVLEGGVVAQGKLLVPLLGTYPVLPSERIETVYVQRNVRQCYGIGAVP